MSSKKENIVSTGGGNKQKVNDKLVAQGAGNRREKVSAPTSRKDDDLVASGAGNKRVKTK